MITGLVHRRAIIDLREQHRRELRELREENRRQIAQIREQEAESIQNAIEEFKGEALFPEVVETCKVVVLNITAPEDFVFEGIRTAHWNINDAEGFARLTFQI